jgi:hypothetical protein
MVMSLRLFQSLLSPAYQIPPEAEAGFADESLCRRCGRCCHSAMRLSGKFVLLKDLPCRRLTWEDDGRARCRIYERREATGYCNKLSRSSVERNLFPPDCPYMQGIPGYQGKVEVREDEFLALLPDLRKIFQGYPKPFAVTKRDWDHFLSKVLKLDGGSR